MLLELLRQLVERLEPEELLGAAHLAHRVLPAALVLEDEHAVARVELEHAAHLVEVEAAEDRVV